MEGNVWGDAWKLIKQEVCTKTNLFSGPASRTSPAAKRCDGYLSQLDYLYKEEFPHILYVQVWSLCTVYSYFIFYSEHDDILHTWT